MSPRRVASLLAGGLAVAVLVALLPPEVAAVTRAILLFAASAILLLVAAALFLLPARRLLVRAFGLPLGLDGPWLGLPRESEMRVALSPLVGAGVCLGVALLIAPLRALLT